MNIGILLAFGAVLAFSAPAPDKYAKDGKQDAGPRYDKATVTEVTAKVADVWEVPKPAPMDGVYLTVKAGSETLDVYLGPADFLKMAGMSFAKGDRIDVTGSRVMMFDGSDLLLASEVRRGNITLMLRDENGVPFWQ